ncbi:MAG: hypothetical protein K2K39_01385 [Clostridia bacterium]|nr:hypothetical protein [Clostridia bacterium]
MKKFAFTPKNIVLLVFIAVEAAIYITFNILSATLPDDPIYLKYAGVLLCLAFAGASIYFERDKDAVILTVALVFTAISDLFILVLNTYYQIGLITFIATQSVYLYRMYVDRIKKIKITLVVRALAAALLMAVMDVMMKEAGGLNFMIAEVCIYIVMLVGNVVDAFILVNKSAKNIVFAVGLLLFLGCDICVGLDNAAMVVSSLDLGSAARAVNFLIWVFYLPSQVLIACTAKKGGICAKADKKTVEVEANESVEPESTQGN